jgi:hypothetical protein
MERSTGAISLERAEVQCLGDDTLAGERRIAVDGDRERGRRIVVGVAASALGLLGARAAIHHRRDILQVTRIGREADGDRLALGSLVRPFGTVVIFDVAGTTLGRWLFAFHLPPALELGEDRLVWPSHGVRQHVEPAAVSHSDDYVPRS